MSAAEETARQVQALIDLQLEFTAATEAMNQDWVIYRNARPNAALLDAYTACVDRCQELKTEIYQFKIAGRAAA